MVRKNRRRPTRKESRDKKSRRFRQWVVGPVWLSLLTVLGAGLGFGFYQVACFLKTSPAFSVRSIEVRGAKRTKTQDLLATTGIAKGMNIFSISLGEIEERARNLPWVREARVFRLVPDTVIIELWEYTPVAVINLQALYYVSRSGEVFKRVQPGDKADLPVFTGYSRTNFKDEPHQVKKSVIECLGLLDLVRTLPCLRAYKVAEISVDELMGSTVVFDPNAVSVRLGHDLIGTRLETVCRLFDRLAERKLKPDTILLDTRKRPNWATVRLDGGQLAMNETILKTRID